MTAPAPLASRISARVPRLATAARGVAWKARNLPRSTGFSIEGDLVDHDLLAELRERGIAVRPFDEVFADGGELERLQRATADPSYRQQSTKDFLTRLMPPTIEFEDPYVAPALEPRLIALANAYIGMHSYLRAIDVWENHPTDEPPKLSQLWHRDYDDTINLKVFVYLSDVTSEHGPFSFAAGTQPGGRRELPIGTRLSDEEMEAHVAREHWVVATGPPGTVVLADTCGYHKGGKPTAGNRLLWTAQYTSGAAVHGRTFEFAPPLPPTLPLSKAQRYALYTKPRGRA